MLQQSGYISGLNNCLRKIVAIFLLFIFLLNLVGYQYFIGYLQNKADIALDSRIDNNEYDDAQLIEMRVALNMPYQHRFTEFERHYGEINIEGKIYRYVKRKIEGDVLILKCIPNEKKELLREKSNYITKSNSGNTSDTNKKSNNTLKVISGDYDDTHSFLSLASSLPATIAMKTFINEATCNGYLQTSQHPPDRAC